MSMMMIKSSSTHFLISRPLTCKVKRQWQAEWETVALRHHFGRGVVAHTYNSKTLEVEAGGTLSLRPAWAIE